MYMHMYILICFSRLSTVVSKLLKVTQEIRSQEGLAPRSSDPWYQENLSYSTGQSLPAACVSCTAQLLL